MADDRVPAPDPIRPPRWAEAILRAVLTPAEGETESGDLLEAYRDSFYPARGRWRADLWYVRQVGGYALRAAVLRLTANATTILAVALGLVVVLFLMVAVGGIAVLGTLVGTAVVLTLTPVLLLRGRRLAAGKLVARWGLYLAFYVTVSTIMAILQLRFEHPVSIGKEVCADSGCFAVDKVARTATQATTLYTLFWHLSSTDRELTKRFPGKGLKLYLFDERGRKFVLPADANQNPLDLTVHAGETVRQSMTFNVPPDAAELFLTAEYGSFTYQSLFPGTLSLVPLKPGPMIRIQ